jgi:hypothetical protein
MTARGRLVWGAEMPLDYAADQVRMYQQARRFLRRDATRAWPGFDPESVQFHWGVKAAPWTADADGAVRTGEWDIDTPPPAWAHTLLLVITARETT